MSMISLCHVHGDAADCGAECLARAQVAAACATMSRRQLIGSLACAATLLSAHTACAAQRGSEFTPEQFGASGDGRTDDHAALVRLASAVSRAGGGTIRFARGRRYRIDQVLATREPNRVDIGHVAFIGCNGLTIDLNGATIDVKGDFHRAAGGRRGRQSSAHAVIPLFFEGCSNLTVRNGIMNGNAGLTTADDSVAEGPGHGILLIGCSRVQLEDLHIHHFTGDGVYIRAARNRRSSRDIRLANVRLTNNARQGLTIAGAAGVTALDCDFSATGRTGGAYHRSPGAGVDLEPGHDYDLPSDFRAERCRFEDNRGSAVVAGSPDRIGLVELINCSGSRRRSGRLILSSAQTRIRGGNWHNIQIACAFAAHQEFRTPINIEVSGGVWTGDDPNWTPVYDLGPRRPNTWIHDNRFELRSPQPFTETYLFRCANPNHRFEENEIFVARTGHAGRGDDLIGQFTHAIVRGNRWSTDLRGPGRFVNNYHQAQRVAEERFSGAFAAIGMQG